VKVEYTREDGFIGKLPTHAAESVEQVLTEFNLTAVRTITIKMVTIISLVHRIVMTMVSKHCGFQMLSTEGGTIMPQYMKDVANMMHHIDSHSRQAEKQYFSIMDDGLFGTACPQPHLIGQPFQH
jgi:hypothetical protein